MCGVELAQGGLGNKVYVKSLKYILSILLRLFLHTIELSLAPLFTNDG